MTPEEHKAEMRKLLASLPPSKPEKKPPPKSFPEGLDESDFPPLARSKKPKRKPFIYIDSTKGSPLPPKSHFLSLPRELRNMIYKEVANNALKDGSKHKVPGSIPTFEMLNETRNVGLLFTNRQIHSEFAEELYKHVGHLIDSWPIELPRRKPNERPSETHIIKVGKYLNNVQMSRLRSLEIRVMREDWLKNFISHSFICCHNLYDVILKQCPNLRTLKIKIRLDNYTSIYMDAETCPEMLDNVEAFLEFEPPLESNLLVYEVIVDHPRPLDTSVAGRTIKRAQSHMPFQDVVEKWVYEGYDFLQVLRDWYAMGGQLESYKMKTVHPPQNIEVEEVYKKWVSSGRPPAWDIISKEVDDAEELMGFFVALYR